MKTRADLAKEDISIPATTKGDNDGLIYLTPKEVMQCDLVGESDDEGMIEAYHPVYGYLEIYNVDVE